MPPEMTNEENIDQQEEMIEEPIEGDPPVESEPEPQAEPQAKPDDELRALWEEHVPDIGFDDLSPESRIKVLLKRQAASAADPAAKDGEPAATAEQNASKPPVPEFQPVDVEALRSELATSLGDEDQANAILKPIAAAIQYINGMSKLVLGSSKEMETTLSTYVLPQQFHQLVEEGTVEGATSADVKEAVKLFKSGEVRKMETALKVAMLNRSSKSPQRPASDMARRRAESYLASQQAAPGSSKSTAPLTRIPQTDAEWREQLKREAQEQNRRRRPK